MISENEKLDKVYTAKNSKDLMEAYSEWAEDYDKELLGDFGYVAHVATAEALAINLSEKEAEILDAGCGTGLVGEELQKQGFDTIDALDYSEAMLDVARSKGVYRKVFHADLSKVLDIPDQTYDAVVCTGTFTYGHVNADAFAELLRITRPGGVVGFTVREGAFEDLGYDKRMDEMTERGVWKPVSRTDVDYLKKEGVTCKLCVFKVAG